MNPILEANKQLLAELSVIEERRTAARKASAHTPTLGVDQIVPRLLGLANHGKRRTIIGVGGLPASGKTTFSYELVAKLANHVGWPCAAHLPMDGFHFKNETLRAMGLNVIKGDITTYDLPRFARTLSEFRDGGYEELRAPDYIREEHEVREGCIRIAGDVTILITEGIYVGLASNPWDEVRRILDVLIFLDAKPSECADRIVARNLAVGRTADEIEHKLANDFNFMDRSIEILAQADFIVVPAPGDS